MKRIICILLSLYFVSSISLCEENNSEKLTDWEITKFKDQLNLRGCDYKDHCADYKKNLIKLKPELYPVIIEELKNPGSWLRFCNAVRRIVDDARDDGDLFLPYVLDAMVDYSMDESIRSCAAESLKSIGNPSNCGTLLSALVKERKIYVKSSLFESISQICGQEAIDTLEDMVSEPGEWSITINKKGTETNEDEQYIRNRVEWSIKKIQRRMIRNEIGNEKDRGKRLSLRVKLIEMMKYDVSEMEKKYGDHKARLAKELSDEVQALKIDIGEIEEQNE